MSDDIVLPPEQRLGLMVRAVVEDDLPKSARQALIVILAELIRRKHVSSWKGLVREAERVARVLPQYGNTKVAEEQKRLEELILKIKWYDLLYLIELIYEKHLQPIHESAWSSPKPREILSLADVRLEFEREIIESWSKR